MQVIANGFDLFWVQFVFKYDSNDSIRFKFNTINKFMSQKTWQNVCLHAFYYLTLISLLSAAFDRFHLHSA